MAQTILDLQGSSASRRKSIAMLHATARTTILEGIAAGHFIGWRSFRGLILPPISVRVMKMSYTVFDHVSDELFDALRTQESRGFYSCPYSEEDRLLDQEFERLVGKLWEEVDFLKAHPEIGGTNARDPSQLAQARQAFAERSRPKCLAFQRSRRTIEAVD